MGWKNETLHWLYICFTFERVLNGVCRVLLYIGVADGLLLEMLGDDLGWLSWLMGTFVGFCGRFIGLAWKWSEEGLSWGCGECLRGV